MSENTTPSDTQAILDSLKVKYNVQTQPVQIGSMEVVEMLNDYILKLARGEGSIEQRLNLEKVINDAWDMALLDARLKVAALEAKINKINKIRNK